MKTKKIECLEKKVLLVDLGNANRRFAGIVSDSLFYYGEQMNEDDYPISVPMPDGTWHYLSRLSEVTEEQCKEMVKRMPFDFSDRYLDYGKHIYSPSHFATAKQSFLSALEAEGVMLENVLGEQPTYFTLPNSDLHSVTWEDLMIEWRQAEANVFNPLTALIFIEQ